LFSIAFILSFLPPIVDIRPEVFKQKMSYILLVGLFYVGASASVPRSLNFNTTVGPDGKCSQEHGF
jgi:hypothetical protein